MNSEPHLQSTLLANARQKCIASRKARPSSYASQMRQVPSPQNFEEAMLFVEHYYKLSTHYHFELDGINKHKLTPALKKLTDINGKLTKGGNTKALLYKTRKEVFIKEVDNFHKEHGRFPEPKRELLIILETNHPAPDDYKPVKGKNDSLMPYWCLETIKDWLKTYKKEGVL